MFKAINYDGTLYGRWSNRNNLLFYIKECWDRSEYRWGCFNLVKDNYFLNICCHNFNEFIPRREPVIHRDEDGNYLYTTWNKWKEYKSVMLVDEYDRIMNIKDLAYEAWFANPTKPILKRRRWRRRSQYWDTYWAIRTKRFRHPHITNYYRRPRTQQERRIGCDQMHKPYIRNKRGLHYLDPWNIEKHPHVEITWKQMKIKKQWMGKQKENKNVRKD